MGVVGAVRGDEKCDNSSACVLVVLKKSICLVCGDGLSLNQVHSFFGFSKNLVSINTGNGADNCHRTCPASDDKIVAN